MESKRQLVAIGGNGFGLFLRLRSTVEELRSRAPIDVIHAHGPLPCGHAAALLSHNFQIPFVVTVHGLDAFATRQVSGWAAAQCAKASRRVYAAARQVIGVSRRVCEEVQKGMAGLSTVSVIYNGVDPSQFTVGEDPAHPRLLTVGNLIPTKGHESVVRAMAAILPEFPTLVWEVIGDGPELNRIRSLADRLGVLPSIRFRGRLDRHVVAQACRDCTIFVLPSRYEGLGCVYLEAMACGKAAIGCTGQGIAEVIRHGESGWLVSPDGAQGLVEGMRVLLGDNERRRQIGVAARSTVLQSFTLAHQAQKLFGLFQGIRV